MMEDAATLAAGPEAAVVASAGLLGGFSNLLMSASAGAAGAAGGAGLLLGAFSAAAGALAAKSWCDRTDQAAISERLLEVRRHLPQSTALGVDPVDAMRQLLQFLDWYLAAEEERQPQSASAMALSCVTGQRIGSHQRAGSGPKLSDKELKKVLRRVRSFCPEPPKRSSASRRKTSPARGAGSRSGGGMVGLAVPGSNEAYEKLFNPQWGAVRSKQGVCSALAYLLSSFLDLRRHQRGNLADGPRVSLRLALSALAMHSVFDEASQEEHSAAPLSLNLSRSAEDALEEENGKATDNQDEKQQFRSAALALICVLDAALSWRPADPLGWTGSCEDSEGAALVRERGLCSFQFVAGRLRKALKKATSGSQAAWRRLEVHLDAVRSRELPEPWPWVWTLNEEASMLVRNRTKVELRVELYKPRSMHPSPRADWPLIINILRLLRGSTEPDPVLVAEVGPGIEWALRPRSSEGRDFKVRLLTKSGVVVNSKHIRRGQSLDFEVPVPPPPARLRVAAFAERSKRGARQRRAKPKKDHDTSEAWHEEREGSVCSTTAPSQLSFRTGTSFASTAASVRSSSSTMGARLSIGSSAGSADGHREAQQEALPPALEQFQAKMAERRRLVEGLGSIESEQEEEVTSNDEDDSAPAIRGFLKEDEGFHTAICPRCLHNMPLRCHRPLASIYRGGVSCDHCGVQLLGDAGEEDDAAELQPQNAFCHCSRCWFDLCRACAWREMQEVWWDGE
eukprot:TRINITY_DN28431_c0_g2_i1.p1 TRINITY_DN28431_c0_g2~~TRINITY_DN28431_c0_g2_i1.p1  ORF type:complete len:738 (-),score=106.23 TRINITY_DN28431_c0_g2_i1:181-2394(-)